jgi:hypothetical protein
VRIFEDVFLGCSNAGEAVLTGDLEIGAGVGEKISVGTKAKRLERGMLAYMQLSSPGSLPFVSPMIFWRSGETEMRE